MKTKVSETALAVILTFEGLMLILIGFANINLWGMALSLVAGVAGSILFGLGLYWIFGRDDE